MNVVERFLTVYKTVITLFILRLAFSATGLNETICRTVLLSFLKSACSSDKCSSGGVFNLSISVVVKALPKWLNCYCLYPAVYRRIVRPPSAP